MVISLQQHLKGIIVKSAFSVHSLTQCSTNCITITHSHRYLQLKLRNKSNSTTPSSESNLLLVMMMGKKRNWSWTSAIIGATSAIAASAILSAKPKDPTFHLISINFTSLKLNLPVLDAEVLLTVHVTNPNIAPIHYSSTTMSIFYEGSLLGSADVQAGSQPPRSCQLLRLPARLKALQLAQHASRFVADVAKREMTLDAAVDIAGTARVLWWNHNFVVRVNSHITVDPVFLDVIDQENTSQLELFASA